MSHHPDADPSVATDQKTLANTFAASLDAAAVHDKRRLTFSGSAVLMAAGAATAAIYFGHGSDATLTHQLPFSEPAQASIESVDAVLGVAGEILVPLALGSIALVKFGARRNSTLRYIDDRSSTELSDEGKRAPGQIKKAMTAVVTDSLPFIPIAAVGLAGIMASVGQEITDGPSRPIEAIFAEAPGDIMAVQYKDAMPMVQSGVSHRLSNQIALTATQHDVTATTININLGVVTYDGKSFDAFVAGTEELAYPVTTNKDISCDNVPVKLDAAADIPTGSHIMVDGVTAVVTSELHGTSAIQRIGVATDRDHVAACFGQNPNAADHAIVLNTDAKTANTIIAEANKDLDAPVALITKEQYIKNSQIFWKANVKPVTNVISVMSAILSFVSMGGFVRSRMLRNRRELATVLARRAPDSQMRAIELLRAAKDGISASVVGTVIGTIFAPSINFLEPGLRVGMNFQSAMVGCAVGILGSVGGAITAVARPRRTINVAEQTRT